MTDVCLCEYTDHGHCGVIDGQEVDNDATLPILAAEALAHAKAGADVVAPSDMMDGRVGAIREALDGNGFTERPDPRLRGEVRERLLRPVPRGGRVDARLRRPPRLPDGPGERPRGGARRSSPTSTRGPTWSWSSRRSPYLDVVRAAKEATNVPLADLQRLGRVRDGEGRRASGAGSTASASRSRS